MYLTSDAVPSCNTTSTTTVVMPQLTTPPDVEAYLKQMGFIPAYGASGTKWIRNDVSGYMTWEQAVAYCLVKPWLTMGEA